MCAHVSQITQAPTHPHKGCLYEPTSVTQINTDSYVSGILCDHTQKSLKFLCIFSIKKSKSMNLENLNALVLVTQKADWCFTRPSLGSMSCAC